MKRLDFTRRFRSNPMHARNTAEAVMFLAQVTRERQRLQQEKTTLEKRIRRLDARLGLLAGTEARLVPVIQLGTQRMSEVMDAGVRAPGNAAATLQY